MTHRTSITVRWGELDPYNHLNHALYFSFFEAARVEALDVAGYSMSRLEEEGCRIVVTKINARFLASAAGGDRLDIETGVEEIRRASTAWRQVMRRSEQELATLDVVGAITDLDGRPRRLPPGFAEALQPLLP